jgi:hypothetical protein
MNGIRLEELEARDMLDVIHYLFEDSAIAFSAEHFESRNNVRNIVYPSMYGTPYKYGDKSSNGGDYGFDDLDEPVNFSPDIQTETKPYFPPTDFNPDAANPFGGALREAPLG